MQERCYKYIYISIIFLLRQISETKYKRHIEHYYLNFLINKKQGQAKSRFLSYFILIHLINFIIIAN